MSNKNHSYMTPNLKSSKACMFCRMDITNVMYIRCDDPVCHKFDICLRCFADGLSIYPHEAHHPFKLIDSINIPVFTDDWVANEEIALLDAIEKYGFGNWAEISQFIGRKNELQCEEHYFTTYLFSTTSPLPDLTMPWPQPAYELLKNEQEARESYNPEFLQFCIDNNDVIDYRDLQYHPTERRYILSDSDYLRLRQLQQHFEKPYEASRWKSQQSEFRQQAKNTLGHNLGYLSQRNDLEVEYMNDAEKDLCDMEFRCDDTPIELEIKLRVLEVYNKVLDARAERKEFLDRYTLLVKREKRMTREERDVYKTLRPFARYLEPEEFDELVRATVAERALRRRIEQLQTYRLNGITNISDGTAFDNEYNKISKQWLNRFRAKYLNPSHVPVGQFVKVQGILTRLGAGISPRRSHNIPPSPSSSSSSSSSSPQSAEQSIKQQNDSTNTMDDKTPQQQQQQPQRGGRNTGRATRRSTARNNHDNGTNSGSASDQQHGYDQNNIPSDYNTESIVNTNSTTQINIQNTSVTCTTQHFADHNIQSPFNNDNNNTTNQNTTVIQGPSLSIDSEKLAALNKDGNAMTNSHLLNLLTPSELLLCQELMLPPAHYIALKNRLIKEAISKGFITRGAARSVIKVDVTATDKIIHFTLSKNVLSGITP